MFVSSNYKKEKECHLLIKFAAAIMISFFENSNEREISKIYKDAKLNCTHEHRKKG